MCLYIGQDKRIRTSTRDKVVYKLLDRDGNLFKPPFYPSTYRLGKTKTVSKFSGFDGTRIRRFIEFPPELRTVERGLHSYRNLQVARELKSYGQVIVKCVIPKGTPYINGEDNEIVSLALRPVKIVV